jgi:hypothetical protein
MRANVEEAIFDLDAVEFATCSSRRYKVQPLVQYRCASFDEAGGIGLLSDADVPNGFGSKQVILKSPIIAAACDPDITAT